jgi:hypothetical protein
MLHVDIPTEAEIRALVARRANPAVSLYVPTTPETQYVGQARIALGNLLKQAEAQMEAAGIAKRTIWPIAEQVADLIDDDGFWVQQARSLAVFVTTEGLQSFRLPNHLGPKLEVADRFHLKPLLRAVWFDQHAFVLALAENEVRLVEVFPDLPATTVRVPGMPRDAAQTVGRANVNSRCWIGGSEGQRLLLRVYARAVDAALRPILAGRSEPLILAAAEPMLSAFRSVCTYDGLAGPAIEGFAGRDSDDALADAARPILDALAAARLAAVAAQYAERRGEGRATAQIEHAARAATLGAVDTLVVDIDAEVPGSLDEDSGSVTFAGADDAVAYDVIDEIARRTLSHGGRVLAVRAAEVPGGGALAAILRYPV